MLRRLLLVGARAALAVAAPAALQTPTFKSDIDLVTVDVSATARDGLPIPDLSADEVRVEVDGGARRVVALRFVGRTPSAPRTRRGDVEFSSNEFSDEGRLVVIAVDQQHIRPVEGTHALRAAARFVEALDARDRVAIASLAHLGPLEFTRDRQLATLRLERLTGEADPVFLQYNVGLSEALQSGDGNRTALTLLIRRECGQSPTRPADQARLGDDRTPLDPCPQQIEQEARAIAQHVRTSTAITSDALRRLIASLRPLDGPKTVVLLSEGLVAEPEYSDFSQLAIAAREARVTIYALQLDVPLADAAESRRSPTLVEDRHLRTDGLVRVTDAARGAVFQLVGGNPAPFERIAREMSGYYLVGFEPRDTDRDGREHRIVVSLTRPAASIRARPTFRIPSPHGAAAVEDALVRLLTSGASVTELPLRVATFTLRDRDARVRGIVSIESEERAAEGNGMSVAFVLRDAADVIVASGASRASTAAFAFSAPLAAGEYKVRIAAIDDLGRHGVVDRSFSARVPATGGMSDLILARVPRTADAALEPIVDRAPGDRMLAYVELYPETGADIRRTSVVMTVARSEHDTPIATVPATLRRSATGGLAAQAVLTLKGLAAGRYVVRAVVTEQERPASIATRAFSIP